jgi:hypothetical protein
MQNDQGKNSEIGLKARRQYSSPPDLNLPLLHLSRSPLDDHDAGRVRMGQRIEDLEQLVEL